MKIYLFSLFLLLPIRLVLAQDRQWSEMEFLKNAAKETLHHTPKSKINRKPAIPPKQLYKDIEYVQDEISIGQAAIQRSVSKNTADELLKEMQDQAKQLPKAVKVYDYIDSNVTRIGKKINRKRSR
jgi:exopolysaccharide biosynthesis protein